MPCPYRPCARSYEEYYKNQAGRGINYFVGRSHQRGRGFGNLLSGIGRALVPLIKSSGKTILKEGLNTGLNVVGDMISGQNLKTSLKNRSKQAGKRLYHQAVGRLTSGSAPLPRPPGQPIQKRSKKNPSTGRKRQSRKRNKTRNISGDIFN